MRGARFKAIRPLLEEQPYIRGVKWMDECDVATHDFSTFRRLPRGDDNLAQWQARHLGVTISEDPWLTAGVNPKHEGRTVIARSARYHERSFPWVSLLCEHPDPLFVGLPSEHQVFQHRFGPVEFAPTEDFWQLACILAGAKLVISNQTAAFWVAIGLGRATIQETWSGSRDSIIRRPNAKYFYPHEPQHLTPRRLVAKL